MFPGCVCFLCTLVRSWLPFPLVKCESAVPFSCGRTVGVTTVVGCVRSDYARIIHLRYVYQAFTKFRWGSIVVILNGDILFYSRALPKTLKSVSWLSLPSLSCDSNQRIRFSCRSGAAVAASWARFTSRPWITLLFCLVLFCADFDLHFLFSFG